jgi:hypothetical protein
MPRRDPTALSAPLLRVKPPLDCSCLNDFDFIVDPHGEDDFDLLNDMADRPEAWLTQHYPEFTFEWKEGTKPKGHRFMKWSQRGGRRGWMCADWRKV